MYVNFLRVRADLPEILDPLSNSVMVCDCNLEQWCIGHALVEKFSRVFSDSNDEEALEEKRDALCPECVLAGFDEDDDSVDFESNLDAEGGCGSALYPRGRSCQRDCACCEAASSPGETSLAALLDSFDTHHSLCCRACLLGDLRW